MKLQKDKISMHESRLEDFESIRRQEIRCHPDLKEFDTLDLKITDTAVNFRNRFKPDAAIDRFGRSPAVAFDDQCIDAVRNRVKIRNFTYSEIASGAGRGSANILKVVPTSMIFLPCDGGASRKELEISSKESCESGTNVLLQRAAACAGASV